MRGHDEVKRAVDRLSADVERSLEGLDEDALVERILAEKNKTIEELRAALDAQSRFLGHVKRLMPMRLLRKVGAVDLVKKSVLGVDKKKR